jgi:uncharacterized protein (AIM24 family)
MDKDSIQEFINTNVQDERANATFEKENSYMLEVKLDGKIWAKIAYTGAVRFTREGMLEHGVGKFLKKVVTGVGARLMKMEGNGRVYLADRGKKVQILNLQEETIFVNGNDLLAFQDQVEWDITMMRRISGMMTGGLFNIRLSGSGMVAITTHYDPLTLRVSPGQSVFTDPNATVAWSGSLSPDIHIDVTFRTFLGRGSGESIQLKFEGDGWVVLQPFEEVYFPKS